MWAPLREKGRQSVRALGFGALVVSIALGLTLGLTFVLGDTNTRLSVIAVFLGALISLTLALAAYIYATITAVADLSIRLTTHRALRNFYDDTAELVEEIYKHPDEIYGRLARQEIGEFVHKLRLKLQHGVLVYRSEVWRQPYHELLQQPDIHQYKSIAWVKSPHYWDDPAGRASLRFNYTWAKDRPQGSLRRIFLIRESVWNDTKVNSLLRGHVRNHIPIKIARENDVPADYQWDLGIYGNRAVGYQTTNDQSETEEFELTFAAQAVSIAENRFTALEQYCLHPNDYADQMGSMLGGEPVYDSDGWLTGVKESDSGASETPDLKDDEGR